MENKTKLVGVNHITFDNQYKEKIYYFKTSDEVKVNDVVLCDTQYGVTLGIAREVIDDIPVQDLIESNKYDFLKFGVKIKRCKILPDYKKIELKSIQELPF